tara:strand:- start:2662 stop:3723 length:1062 start_codon:yes stop_codon:yes gene_type:complete
MSQNDFNIANQGFPSFRSDLNDALQALASNSSGATEPATTYAGQFWYDSTNDVLKFRNEANSAWIDPPIAGLVQALSDLGVTASAAELNKMDGVTASTAEINYIDGVTSNIQTQLNAKGVGDITGVTAGTNLTGGGTSGGVTVNLTASPNITSLSVGSSEVISSARQLKNIASVDSTTVAAMGAAGVGGNTVFLGETLITSDASYIQYNFPSGYQRFVFQMVGWKTNTGWRNLRCRLTDSSNNLLSSSGMYYFGTLHVTALDPDDEIRLGVVSGAADTAPATNMVINIESPRDSNTATSIKAIGHAKDSSQVIPNAWMGVRMAFEQNNGIRFYPASSGSFGSGSYSYRVWGIK